MPAGTAKTRAELVTQTDVAVDPNAAPGGNTSDNVNALIQDIIASLPFVRERGAQFCLGANVIGDVGTTTPVAFEVDGLVSNRITPGTQPFWDTATNVASGIAEGDELDISLEFSFVPTGTPDGVEIIVEDNPTGTAWVERRRYRFALAKAVGGVLTGTPPMRLLREVDANAAANGVRLRLLAVGGQLNGVSNPIITIRKVGDGLVDVV